jgi:tRNA(Ile)-lysidine synthase
MVLLDLFVRLRREYSWEVAAAHLNHGLRGRESDGDEEFVRAEAARHGLHCFAERADTARAAEERKISIEEAGRELRREFFTRVRRSGGFHSIATAHHADDNAETIALNFTRGAGIEGLSGIPVRNRDLSIIRPLLFARREEIAAYARGKGIAFREDATNSDTVHTRNFFRHTLLPLLRENVNPNFTATMLRTAEIFDGLDSYLDGEAQKLTAELLPERTHDQIVIAIDALEAKPLFLREYFLLHTARSFTGSAVTFGTVRAMLAMTEAESGSSSDIGDGCVCVRDRNRLVLRRGRTGKPFRYEVEPLQQYAFDGFRFSSAWAERPRPVRRPGGSSIEFIDASRLQSPLVLRTWQSGDTFVPLGMRASKKLSDYFIDTKVPAYEKGIIPLLVSGSEIIWVCGKRLDDRWKITPATSRILRLEYSPRTSNAPE